MRAEFIPFVYISNGTTKLLLTLGVIKLEMVLHLLIIENNLIL